MEWILPDPSAQEISGTAASYHTVFTKGKGKNAIDNPVYQVC